MDTDESDADVYEFKSIAAYFSQFPRILNHFHSLCIGRMPKYSSKSEHSLYDPKFIPDVGGSTPSIDFVDGDLQYHQVKNDSLTGLIDFLPVCCSLPLALSIPQVNPIPLECNIVNNLVYEDRISTLFRIAGKRKLVIEILKDPSEISKDRAWSVYPDDEIIKKRQSLPILLEGNGLVRDLTPVWFADDMRLHILQDNALTTLDIEGAGVPQDGSGRKTWNVKTRSVKDPAEGSKYSHFAVNEFFPSHLALCRYSQDNGVLDDLEVFDQDTNGYLWNLELIKESAISANMRGCVGIEWNSNHPKLLNYSETRNFGILDTRVNPREAFRFVFSVGEQELIDHMFLWEKIRMTKQVPWFDHQYILATDYKLVLVDDRFPNRNLVQWNHMLEFNHSNRLRQLKMHRYKNDSTGCKFLLVVANNRDVCALTLERSSEYDSLVTPKSLHYPIHLSKTLDCWNLAENSNPYVESRLRRNVISGLAIVPCDNGMFLFQSTNNGDLFVQEFTHRICEGGTPEFSWKYKGSQHIGLDPKYNDYLQKAFDDLIQNECFIIDHLEILKPSGAEKIPNDRPLEFETLRSEIRSVEDIKQDDVGEVSEIIKNIADCEDKTPEERWGATAAKMASLWSKSYANDDDIRLSGNKRVDGFESIFLNKDS